MTFKPDSQALEALKLCRPHPRDKRLLFTFEKAGCHAIRLPKINGLIWRNPINATIRKLFNSLSIEGCQNMRRKLNHANLTYLNPRSDYFARTSNDNDRNWPIMNFDQIDVVPKAFTDELNDLSAHIACVVKSDEVNISTQGYEFVIRPHIDTGEVAYRMFKAYSGKGLVAFPGKFTWEEYNNIIKGLKTLDEIAHFKLMHEHIICEKGDVAIIKGLEYLTPQYKGIVPGLLHCSPDLGDGYDRHWDCDKNKFEERFQVEFHARPSKDPNITLC
ncbi:MAG: DUF1826 domain-containing protein [Micavibrio sp.]|nr:DUF1826 domain-containing protein [Micavibrio sp.]